RSQADDAEDRTHGWNSWGGCCVWWDGRTPVAGTKKPASADAGLVFARPLLLCLVAPPHRPRTVVLRNIVAVGIGRIGARGGRHGPTLNRPPAGRNRCLGN